MNNSRLLFSAFVLLAVGCGKQSGSPVSTVEEDIPVHSSLYTAPNGARLIFKTEFDNSSLPAGNSEETDISGTNIPDYAWNMTDFNFGPAFKIQYQGGDISQRKAVLATEGSNNIVDFIISGVNIPTTNPPKSRIQANIYGLKNPTDGNKPFKEIYQSIRMKLDYNSFHKIRLDHNRLVKPTEISTYNSRDWLTLFEFWNNSSWDATNSGTTPDATNIYPFRISVNLEKRLVTNSQGQTTYETGSTPDQLIFSVNAQKSYSATNLNWEQDAGYENVYVWKVSPNYTLPLGVWMTIEIYMKEGDESTGKFWMSVQPDGQPKTVICNKTGRTFSPYDPSPNGISDINPFKLYTSGAIVNMVKGTANGSVSRDLKVSWDLFRVYDRFPY